MSRGPGQIERRIAGLFAASLVDDDALDDESMLRALLEGPKGTRAFSVADICDHAFALGGAPTSRAQRLSATRAAHRLLRRVRDADAKSRDLVRQAHQNTEAALGRESAGTGETIGRLEDGRALVGLRLALPPVQEHLSREGRRPLSASESSLKAALSRAGKIESAGRDRTRINGQQLRVVSFEATDLIDNPVPVPIKVADPKHCKQMVGV